MWIKICGITRLEDAMAAARFGADAVGFVFEDGARGVTAEEARRIAEALPERTQKVGVFSDAPLEQVRQAAEYCGLDLVQLEGSEGYEYCSELDGRAMKALEVGGPIDVARATRYAQEADCTALVLTRADKAPPVPVPGGAWGLLGLLEGSPRVVISGDIGPDDVADVVASAKPYGVDASTSLEAAPGVKDPVLMYRFIEQARKAAYKASGD
jgi:phosphoribosylanthranilate isomerase